MKPKPAAGLIALTLIAALCLAPAGAAQAGGIRMGGGLSSGGMGGGVGSGGMGGGSVGGGFHGGFHGGGFKNPGGFRGRVVCIHGKCFSSFSIVTGFPGYGGGTLAPLSEPSPPAEAAAPASEPQPRAEVAPVITREACSPTGCYHLEGDGAKVPYRWAWVPNPPPPPPAPMTLPYPNGRYEQRGAVRWVWIPDAPATPQMTAPDEPPTERAPGSVPLVPSQYGQYYRWVDEHGVVHWTQGLESVPERYRSQVGRAGAG